MKLVSEILCFISVKSVTIQNFKSYIALSNGLTYYSKVPVTYDRVKKEFVADDTKRIWSLESGFSQLKWLELSLEPALKYDYYK